MRSLVYEYTLPVLRWVSMLSSIFFNANENELNSTRWNMFLLCTFGHFKDAIQGSSAAENPIKDFAG